MYTSENIQIPSAIASRLNKQDEADVARFLAARDRLLNFAEYTFPNYKRAPHLELIAKELEVIDRGENDRLMIFMPPRHGKSELCSVRFPAWTFGRHPTHDLISISHRVDLASEWGRQVRNTVDLQPLFPNATLAADSKAKNLWHTEAGGRFLAVGVDSGVVGFGGHKIMIDDPHGKPEQTMSEAQLEHGRNWYSTEVLSREEPWTAIVIIMHRWAQNDLAGWRLELDGEQKDGGRWRVIRLPALAEENDILGRAPGEALWEERIPREFLLQREIEVQSRIWNAMYQQRPSPEEGDIFKWFPSYEGELPRFTKIVMSCDTAYSGSARSDFNAWEAWGSTGSLALLLNAEKFRADAPGAEKQFTVRYWNLKQRYPNIPVQVAFKRRVPIDRIAAQHLRMGIATLSERGKPMRAGLPVVEVKLPAGNNEDLAYLVAAEFEAERMLVPSVKAATYGPWMEDWLTQHKEFPNASYDDYVECTLVAGHYLFGHRGPIKRRPPRVLWGQGA